MGEDKYFSHLFAFLKGTTHVHPCLRPSQHEFTDLEDVFVHQDDGLEGGSAFVGQLMERFLFAPALLQQGVTHHTGRAFEARAEVEGDVRARLGAAAVRQVDLKPAERMHTEAGLLTVKVGNCPCKFTSCQSVGLFAPIQYHISEGRSLERRQNVGLLIVYPKKI